MWKVASQRSVSGRTFEHALLELLLLLMMMMLLLLLLLACPSCGDAALWAGAECRTFPVTLDKCTLSHKL
jgi:hypothetical protein